MTVVRDREQKQSMGMHQHEVGHTETGRGSRSGGRARLSRKGVGSERGVEGLNGVDSNLRGGGGGDKCIFFCRKGLADRKSAISHGKEMRRRLSFNVRGGGFRNGEKKLFKKRGRLERGVFRMRRLCDALFCLWDPRI